MTLARTAVAGLVAMLAVVMSIGHSPSRALAAGAPAVDHVFVIAMENHSFSEIVGSPSAPYTNGLLASGALATNYHAVAHPSLPNYLALTGASTFGIGTDCTT